MKSKTHYTIGLVGLAVLTIGGLGLSAQRPSYMLTDDSRLSGTYELESTRGGDPQRTADAATRSLPPGQRDRAYQNLVSRLEPPYMLSIERNGRSVTIESSHGPRSAFEANGRNQSERWDNGRTVTTRAETSGSQIRVTTSGGSRGSDFSVTFESLNNGTNLRVTRRLDDDDLRGPVTIQSYYRRTMATARWDVYASGPGRGYGRGNDSRSGSWFEPMMMMADGTRMLATLDTNVNMRSSRHGEPFYMTVRGPAEFQGARITGVISRVNALRGGDGSDLRVDFQTIEMRGRSYEFDAFLNTVRLFDGTILRVNADGEVRDMNRGYNRNDAVQGGAIGVAVGAIIGAIAGGGKGAAIGAVVGGAGGVILSRDHGQLDLPRGAEVTLTAVTPYRLR